LDRKLLFSSASYAWSLQTICRLHRIPFAPRLLLEQVPPPYSVHSLQQAAELIGFTSELREIGVREVPGLPLPCLAVLKPAEGTTGGDEESSERMPGAHRIALLLKSDTERLWCFRDSEAKATSVTFDEFEREYAGLIVIFERENTSDVGAEDVADDASFGFKWFLPELLRHKAIWRDVLLASLAIQTMALAVPLLTQVTIDKVIVHHTVNTLVVIGTALAVFVIFTAVMSYARQYLLLHTGNRIDAVLGAHVFEHLLKLPARYFESRPTGVLVARLQGVETIREFISGAAVTLILDVPFLLLFLGVMFFYSTTLTLVTCAILLAVVVLSLAITPLLRTRINHQFLLGARNQAFATEYVAGIETVKSLQMEPQLNARYGDYLASYLKAGFDTRQLANTYGIAAHGLEQLMMLGILLLGALLVMESTGFTVGMLVAFQMFATRLSQPMLHMVGLWQQFQQADIAVKRLGDIMNVVPEPYSIIPARQEKLVGSIEVRGLSFRYGDNTPYLYRNLDFTVPAGSCVAIMGPSGSGKSTLAKLLQGFYQPTDGVILLDALDIRHRSANELRHYFGVVPQETVLFSGTVYENLVLANPHADLERVTRACKLAEIHSVIEQLPEGYQTRLGEHGVGLSGGQKQRIAIARALLKQPRILVFDEATSSLDQPTAEQFAKTVSRLKGKVTMLFIAHQLPEGLQLDNVIRLTS
jgi:subfamily B ATP-binding cassette protein HlyB/CyaB